MPDLNITFGGQTLVKPGAYYTDDVSAAGAAVNTNVPPVIFVGNFWGLPKNTPTNFVGQNDAVAAVRGAPVSDIFPFLFSPSSEFNGASTVTLINAATNTQSSLALKNATGTAVMTLTSTNYGLPSNLLQIEVSAGSIGGSLVTLFDGFSGQGVSADNLGVPFTLAYVGAATGAVSYTVAAGTGGQMTLNLISPGAGKSAAIPMGPGGYATVAAVTAFINGTGFYQATAISNGNLPANMLDVVATGITLPPPAAGTPVPVKVTAVLGDILFWVNSQASALATAAVASGVVSSPTQALANLPLTHFAGATNVPPLTADYASAFNIALTTPGWAVITDSTDPAVQALGSQHVQTASSIPYRKWRRFITGAAIGTTVAQAATLARSLNAKEVTLAYPGIFRTSLTTGQNTLYSGIYHAAAVAGGWSGNDLALPMTNKTLSGNGLEFTLDDTDINTLQQAGVQLAYMPDSTSVPTIASDFTTWQNDPNPENVFNQQVACRQYLGYFLTQQLQQYVGGVQSTLSLGKQKRAVIAALNSQVRASEAATGVLNSWDSKSLKLTYTGTTQTLAITVNLVFVGQDRFITFTSFVQPLNLSA